MIVPHNFTNKFQLLDITNNQKAKKLISHKFNIFRTWVQTNLVLQLIEKVKPGFWLSLMCMFLNRTRQNSDLTAFTSKIQVFCRPEWTKGGPHENEFWQFSNTKMNITNSQSLKRWKKNGFISIVSFFSFLSYVP